MEDELCSETAIKEAYSHEIENRLKHNEIHESYFNYELMKNLLCGLYIRAVRHTFSSDFTAKELKNVILTLKIKRSPWRDGITNETLKYAGEGMLKELVRILNTITNDTGSPEK